MSGVTRMAMAVALGLTVQATMAAPITVRVEDPLFQPNASSGAPAVSADGSATAFVSSATNLVADPTTGGLFVYDRIADRIEALMPYGGAQAPSISADGRFVAFVTDANNLAPGTDSQYFEVLRVDRSSGAFARVSPGFGGAAPNSSSETPAISRNGRWVAFSSYASNHVSPSTTPARRHIYLTDMDSGTVQLVTRAANGQEGDRDANPMEPNSMSSDGRRLVFSTGAENITPVFNGNVSDVIVMTRDLQTGAVSYQNVNRSIAGQVGTLSSDRGSISPNGRYVVFRTAAANILATGPGDSDLFVRDLDANSLRAVRLPAGFDACSRARVSDRGDVLMQCAPTSPATALQVFLAPASGAAPRLVTVDWCDGTAGSASSGQNMTFSADGRLIAVESLTTDLVPNDTNFASDVFLVAEQKDFDRLFADGFE
jgi:Tol biopolymer transport system component